MICSIPLIRYIFLREQIQIIHGHSAFSALAHEGMLIGRLLGLKVLNLHILLDKKFIILNLHYFRNLVIILINSEKGKYNLTHFSDSFHRSFLVWVCGCFCDFNE